MKNIKIIIIIIIVIFLFGLASYYRGINSNVAEDREDVKFSVAKGESVGQIGENLYQANLIKSKLFFKVYVRRTEQQANFQAGEYIINPALSIKEIVNTLVTGQSLSKERAIKIIEGWSINDIDRYLKENNVITDNSFIKLAKNRVSNWLLDFEQSEFFKDISSEANFEGYLFPDTYRIYKDSKAKDIIEKMLDNFNNKLNQEMRDSITEQGKTIYEIIIMASLIEKEVRSLEDMQIVSGIFWNRIKNGQPLESCATLAYVLGENKKQYTVEDTKVDSPYNTYQNLGLPPGPICNPGLNAIRAAIYPEYTEYNYFLNRLDNGETVFSKTLEEHNRNKAKYLK